ncbi:hypothetical protein [Luteipulveratus halotolerans]|nr:hypothetical protein [Luteipulveratus halotolerans]
MADLLVRAAWGDEAFLARALTPGPGVARPRGIRIVADAHVIARKPGLAAIARAAGVPLLVDPQTYFLQDTQQATDPWVRLPFGSAGASRPTDFATESAIDDLVHRVVTAQAVGGATAIVPPYFHLGADESGWDDVQARVWRRTPGVMTAAGIGLPRLALVSVDWARLRDPSFLTSDQDLHRAMVAVDPAEVALASSRSHMGRTADARLFDLVTLIHRLAAMTPVIAWQQGVLGEACVAAGAAGYETGIGTRETYDVSRTLAGHRGTASAGPEQQRRQARPVFVPSLGRSVGKRSLEAISRIAPLWALLMCHDAACCRPGGASMLGDARYHAVTSRRRSLDQLTSVEQAHWRWGVLAEKAALATTLATRINRLATDSEDIKRVDPVPLDAITVVSEQLRKPTSRPQTA